MNRLKNLTIAGHIGVAFGFLMLVLTLQSLLGFMAASQSVSLIQTEMRDARAHAGAASAALDAVLAEVNAWQQAAAGEARSPGASPIEGIRAAAVGVDETLLVLTKRPGLRVDAVAAAHQRLQKARQVAMAAMASVPDARPGGDLLLQGAFRELQAALSSTKAAQEAAFDVAMTEVARLASEACVMIVISALVSISAALVAAWALHRSIAKPLGLVVGSADRIAAGDLSVALPPGGDNEMGKMLGALARMAGRFRGTVETMRNSSQTMLTASTEFAAGNLDLSRRTEQQAASVAVAVASVQDMLSGVRQNAEAAHTVRELATVSASMAAQGGEQVTQIVSRMNEISRSSQQMEQIMGVIDGIAFQTNILALNAAVEAARAGEQGRGFAVVASEVRSLAQRSGAAAKEIKSLITNNLATVSVGATLVADAGRSIQDLVASSERVSGMVSGIAETSAGQSRLMEQIDGAVRQLDSGLQQNSALAEQSAAASESLKIQTSALDEALQCFKLEAQSGRAPGR